LFQPLAVPIYGMLANRIDLRWVMMFGLACFALAVLMVPLMRKAGPPSAPSPEAH
jgi:DHA2 family multidrug resistance protein